VLSVFMLGLAIGSWGGGRWIGPLTARTGRSAAFFYAGAELAIGLGAFVVPRIFAVGEKVLLASGETDSFGYLTLSALVLAVSILPWCVCMGTTFPFMMAYIREQERDQTRSFSFLYLANVLGAMSGTLLAAVVCIELLGFQHTLWEAAAGNFVIAFISVCLGLSQPPATTLAGTPATPTGSSQAAVAPTPLGGTAENGFYFRPVSSPWPWKWCGHGHSLRCSRRRCIRLPRLSSLIWARRLSALGGTGEGGAVCSRRHGTSSFRCWRSRPSCRLC
jgi:MFS family permease